MADTPPLKLRPATPTDIDFALRVWQTAMQQYVTEARGWNEEFEVRRQCEGLFRTPYSIIEVDGRRAGTLIMVDQGDHLYVIGLYLLPEYQRHGYGSRVLGDAISQAHSRNVPVRLRCLRTNPAAQRLYDRMGFVVVDDTEPDYVLMEHALVNAASSVHVVEPERL